jgi:tetratricopeptide (TPR) repeat protein
MANTTSRDAIIRHLDSILASPAFVKSKRMGEFLAWVVNQSLSGDEAAITERNIALQVYGRPTDFDPKIDAIVRAEAIRLRNKLREYYESSASSQRIEIRKGAYAPIFVGFGSAPEPRLAVKPSTGLWGRPRIAVMAATVIVSFACAVPYFRARSAASASASSLVAEANRLCLIGDLFSASALLEQAEALRPSSADFHLARAAVFERLGHFTGARAEVVEAEEIAQNRGVLEPALGVRIHTVEFDHQGAAARLRQMLRKKPDSMALLVELARNEGAAEGLAAIQIARRLPGASTNPELDRVEALALGSKGDNPAAIAVAVRGERKAAALKATWALDRLMVLEGGLRLNNDETEAGLSTLRRARELCLLNHDDICVAQTYRIEGNVLYAQRRYLEALRSFRSGLPLTREWENWKESDLIVEGIDAVLTAVYPGSTGSRFRDQRFEVLPKAAH